MLIIWDSNKTPPSNSGVVYRWNGYDESESIHSLLCYAEANGDRLRRKYLAWIHDLGESRIGDKRIIDHLAFEDGLSYWWMTLLAEKSLYRVPISDAIRLFALEEVVVQQRPDNLRLVSGNPILHEIVSALCASMNISYEWEKLSIKRQVLNREIVYKSLPQQFQAVLTLVRHFRRAWPFRHAAKTGWLGGHGALFFCDYFVNVDTEKAASGHFYSRYWEGLHGLLKRMGLSGNWLHHNVHYSPVTALKWLRCFNQNLQEPAFHCFLDAYLSWGIVLRVLKRWVWLNFICWRVREVRHAFQPRKSRICFWPLMRRHWQSSLRGSVAVDNLLAIELFDKALCNLPRQKKGFYLCENNNWERALIHAWRKHGHGQLIGVAHSTVRFWDLRYFFDPRTVRSGAMNNIPKPDGIALNGHAAVSSYLSTDYPRGALIECEALRYEYLNDFLLGEKQTRKSDEAVHALILGDLLSLSTEKLLQLMEAAAKRMTGRFSFTVKPHPASPFDPADFPALQLQVTTEPLETIFEEYDVAYVANVTSAGVDAYLAGLPVVVMLEDTELNFSPLRGFSGVYFVSTSEELAEALQKVRQAGDDRSNSRDFFFLDPEFPRWRALLDDVELQSMRRTM